MYDVPRHSSSSSTTFATAEYRCFHLSSLSSMREPERVCVCVEGLWKGINSNIENLSSLANAVGQITVRCFMNVCAVVVVCTVRTSSIVCVLCSFRKHHIVIWPFFVSFFAQNAIRSFCHPFKLANDQCHSSNLFKRIRSAAAQRHGR